MIFKRKCPRCNESISKKFKFCPFCGFSTKSNSEEDFGMLGENDEVNEENQGNLFDSLNSPILNKVLGGAMKMLEKEMRGLNKMQENPKTNFQLYINGKKVNVPGPGNMQNNMQVRQPVKIRQPTLPIPSEKTILAATGLPRQEAKTSLKRLVNKIIYEINAPGVNSMDKVLINKLEDGIEIRIFTKKAVLCKKIAVKLPIVEYYLKKQKLFIEFQSKPL
jgi:hypothetical protein